MSKVNIVLDTDTKEVSCDIDGEKVTNVCCVRIYVDGYSRSNPEEKYYSLELDTNEGRIGEKIHKTSKIFSYGSKVDKNTGILDKNKIDAKGTLLYIKSNMTELMAQAKKLLGK